MSLIKKNHQLFPSMSGFFTDDFLAPDIFNWNLSDLSNTGTTIPAVNLKETADNFEVEMAAPGMSKKDFKIQLDGNRLTISSEKNEQHETKNGNQFMRKEFSYQSFKRTFDLSKDVVDVDKIQAHYNNGILQLVIPKREEVKKKGPKMIEVA